jgi:ABC-type ATPase involved in cell division
MPSSQQAVITVPTQRRTLVRLLDVSVVYPDGTVGLSHADLCVSAGEVVVITGPSGAGKSTCLAAMAGRVPATSGTVLLDGAPVGPMGPAQLALWRRTTAFVAQDGRMLERRSIAENVAYAIEIARPDVHDVGRQVASVLDELGIGETADRQPRELSGGQRQRAALAQALAKRPAVLFADEPTVNLDPTTAAAVVAVIAAHCETGMACVAASHSEAAFAASATRRLYMTDGRVSAEPCGPPGTAEEPRK